MTIEEHPLEPFLPINAKILFLGSFPPPMARWSMEFFYPNWSNDFWRIQGLIHFNDRKYFEVKKDKKFDKDKIVEFCNEKGIALFDTARKVCRLKDNADDNFLEIMEGTDVFALLEQMPECRTIITTGGKASEELKAYFESYGLKVKVPKVGKYITITKPLHKNTVSLIHEVLEKNPLYWWRMPSSSRAYPMKLEKKAEYYNLLISVFR